MIVRLQSTMDDCRRLVDYLLDVDEDFGTPLSCKVQIPVYAEKILQNGRVYVIEENDQYLALICFYCNDCKRHIAHLPILSTKRQARGKGYARVLIQQMIADCREEHMVRICCDSVNPVAVSLYKSLGFVEDCREGLQSQTKVYLSYYPLQDILLEFLIRIDSDFRPPLSQKVALMDYVCKIQSKAELIQEWIGRKLAGLTILYCNDSDRRFAYIALVGVDSSYRGKGIASKMLQISIRTVRTRGFRILGIHSNNPIAIHLYKKLGFREISRDGDRIYLELEITQSK